MTSAEPDWRFGDLSSWDAWLHQFPPPEDWKRTIVRDWLAFLLSRPWQAPSTPVSLDPPTYEYEIRTAVLPDANVGVDYLINNVTGQIDVDAVVDL